MNIDFTKVFDKQFQKLTKKQQLQARNAIIKFINNAEMPLLRNHKLKGEWQDYRSISAGGDLRLHYKEVSDNHILFVAIGSHNQLYK